VATQPEAEQQPPETVESLLPETQPEARTDEDEGGEAEPPAPDPYGELAQEMGWVPKDQFRGDPDNWKPAKDFILEGRNIQRQLATDLKEMRQTLGHVARTSASIAEQRIAEERAKLEQRFTAAVDDNDHQTAFRISQEINNLKAPTLPPTSDDPVQAFATRNAAWFKVDPAATAAALRAAGDAAQAGFDPAKQIEAAEREVKRLYPELFKSEPQPRPKPQAQVTAPASRAATASARRNGFHDMPKAAQDIAIDMETRGVIKSRNDYATQFFANQKG
jgi:ElaB/YqjD/DUF883 family membrane-anchored ribosome-binding protein